MNESLKYILDKWQLSIPQSPPVRMSLSRHTDLVRLWAELGYKRGAEIGVDRGRYSEQICQANPGVQLYCVDPWIVYGDYIEMRLQDRLDSNRRATTRRLKPFGCTVIQGFSLDVARNIADGSLDFVYIDGNHEFDYVVQDIIAWSAKVRPGGMVTGHDYMRNRNPVKSPCHVIEAVDGYTASHEINPWFVFQGDRCPSWLWVKP